jgi:DNA helicase-2/ATP-dependent DNA helicase PcrA
VPGEAIIAITFTNKAANEMADRVKDKIGVASPFIGTFHALGARILRKYAHAFGRTAHYSIYDEDDARRILKQIPHDNLKHLIKELGPATLLNSFSRIKNECLLIPQISSICKFRQKIPTPPKEMLELFSLYEELLRKNNAFDFDDLIEKPVRLLLQNPSVRASYEQRIKYVLVDEYQDINTAQYLLVRLLSQKTGNICVVGDDNQAIYSFRGADFRNFLNFEHDFPGAKVVLLEENYRSSGNIVFAASEVIKQNTLQKPKNLWTKAPPGAPIKVIETSNPEEEAQSIAALVAKDPKRTAVLYRTNAQSRAIEEALIEEGIPYIIFGGLRFYDRKEIKDLVCAMRYALNPQDTIALKRMEKVFLKDKLRKLQDELPHKAGQLPPAKLLSFIVKETDYFSSLRRHFKNAEERILNIRELAAFASKSDSLGEFLNRIALLDGNDTVPKGQKLSKAACLMTIHLSKGLEFDRVIVAGVAEGLLPHQMSLNTKEEIEEERRLMYVAMTRARYELFLTFYDIASRFLYEIPEQFIEFESTSSASFCLKDEEERYIMRD